MSFVEQISAQCRERAAPAKPARTLLAIDPGHTHSAYVLYSPAAGVPWEFDKVPNDQLLSDIEDWAVCPSALVIEQVACMGMAVGAEVFETVFWSGQFWQAFKERSGCIGGRYRVKRHQVKQYLCGNQRAKDANIRAALIDRYGPGRELAIGTKKNPGPLYGMSGDCWSALAVAVTFADRLAPASPARTEAP